MSNEQNNPEQLSRALERLFSVAHAIPAGRAALGLTAVLKCWIRRGGRGRVALPGAICHEVALAVLEADCEPIFCDVNPADGLVEETEWRRARVNGADVAIAVHLYGNPARLALVRAAFPAPDCLVIDDAAQALGSCSEDGLAGAMGDVGLLSFGPSKQVSIGGAALLFQDEGFAKQVVAFLSEIDPQPEAARNALAVIFRNRLEEARQRLREEGNTGGFTGLLEGLGPVLKVPYSGRHEPAVLQSLANYSAVVGERIARKQQWSNLLRETPLQPVGMGEGCVPWRYACRFPNISWAAQHAIGYKLRAAGMHVSHWYLPAHWFVGEPLGTLPGVESLAREVFQFWVDEHTSAESIARDGAIVRRELSRFEDSWVESES